MYARKRSLHCPPRSGKVDEMWKYLSKCEHVAEGVKQEAQHMVYARKKTRLAKENRTIDDYAPTATPTRLQISPLQPSLSNMPIGNETPSPLSRTWSNESLRTAVDPAVCYGETLPRQRFSRDTQAEFNADLCRLLVVCNIAWWAVENPYWRGFANKWLPTALMPGRKELSGRILDEEVNKVVNKMKPDVQNHYGTGECDGWKNVTKASIIAFIMNVEYVPYLLNIADISAVHKTAKNLLDLVLAEIKYATESLKIIVVAWCTDAGGESAKMRRLLNVRMPWIITLDCWCHQINLIVGDIFKVKNAFVRCMEGAIEVIKWFNNHSRALGKLKDVQRQKFQKVWCLILPVLTRWTSHYLAIRRLLELEIAFKQLLLDDKDDVLLCAGDKREAKDKAEEVIGILEGYNF
ncbi:hypothetical protein LshimejAT787_2500540 [Lyophyllum shimeji]|uniref:DUF659 domain-containing protein n=1 Tax=Lyophyllum shimeji TaxID=47721 RepID=A0A9P3Q2K6_LYOSH|nr:hypothetical protein LshimejAT787_2500540 [Lyophyllum shimeji]